MAFVHVLINGVLAIWLTETIGVVWYFRGVVVRGVLRRLELDGDDLE